MPLCNSNECSAGREGERWGKVRETKDRACVSICSRKRGKIESIEAIGRAGAGECVFVHLLVCYRTRGKEGD